MGTKSSKKKNDINSSKTRKIKKTIKIESYVDFLFVTDFDNQKILLVINYNSIIIYDLENFKKLTSISSGYNFSHSMVKLKNDIFLVLSNSIKTFIIKKSNNKKKKYYIEFKEIIKSSRNDNFDKAINSEFTENTLIMSNKHNIEIDELKYINKKGEIIIERKLISNIKIKKNDLKDFLEIDKEKIAYVDNNYLIIVSKVTNQVILNYRIEISKNCTEIFKMLNKDILCFAGMNFIYFISIKLSVILNKISIGDQNQIFAMETLNDKTILVSSLNTSYYYFGLNVNLFEINCLENQYINEKKEFKTNIKKLFKNKDSSGNWFIRKIKNETFVSSEKNLIHFWK